MSKINSASASLETRRMTGPCLAGTAVVHLVEPVPIVKVARGDVLRQFIRHGAVDVPGVYVGLWHGPSHTFAYVGQSATSVATRLREFKFRLPTPPDFVLTITDRDGVLSPKQVLVIERIMHLGLLADGTEVLGKLPTGAILPEAEYAAIRGFCSTAIRQIRAAGFALGRQSPRAALAGPITQPGVLGARLPEGPRFRLETKRLRAELIETTSHCVVVPGSLIEKPADHAEPTTAVGVIRQELAYSGVLVPLDTGTYRLDRPVAFETASAADQFVTGGRAGSPARWEAVDPDGPKALRRVAMKPRPKPIIPRLAVPARAVPPAVVDARSDLSTPNQMGGFRHD